MAKRTANNKEYYINPSSLTFVEDSGYGANFIQVSASSSCYIFVYSREYGITADEDNGIRKWKVTAYNNKFSDDGPWNIYVRLERGSSSALIVYDKRNRLLSGAIVTQDEEGSEVVGEADEVYFYVKIGTVSETNGTSIRQIEYDTGNLDTPGANLEIANSFKDMFVPHYDDPQDPSKLTWIEAKSNLGVVGGITMYVDNGKLDLPNIYKGLPIDNQTIYWEDILDDEGNKIDQRLKARVVGEGGEGGSVDFSNVLSLGSGNAYTSFELSGDGKVITFVKGETFAKQSDHEALNTKITAFLEGSDTDTIINKWKELEAFLSGMKESDNLATILSGKADKGTTLSAYGITDAYTKSAVDWLLSAKWTTDNSKIANWDTAYGWGNHANAGYLKDADVSGKYLKLSGGVMGKDSSIISAYIYPLEDNKYALGLPNRAYGYVYSHRYFVDDLEIKKSQDDVIYIDANLVVRGGITMYGTDGTTAPSIWDNPPIANTNGKKGVASYDPNFFSVNNGVVTFIGSTGGGEAASVKWANVIGKPTKLSEFTDDVVKGNYVKLSGEGANGIWDISVLGSASKLSHKIVYPSTQYSGRYCKFASLSLTSRYTSKLVHCELSVASSIIKGVGRSCKVYCSIYQQDAMGNAPVYTFKSDIIPDGVISIFGVLNYNSSSSTIDLYISANQQYISVNGISLEGEDLIKNETSSNTLTSIPSGTVINPSLDGYVERASQLNGLYSSKKGGVTNLLTNGNSVGMANDYNFASYTYASEVFQYTTDSNGQVVHDGMYTLTFCGKLGQENAYIAAFWDGGDANHTVIESLSSTEERIVSITARITNKQTLRFYQYPKGKTGSYIKWAVLEKAENVTEEGGTFLCNARRIDFTPGSNDRRMIADGYVSMIRHFAPKSGSGTPGFSFHTITGGTLGWMGAAFSDNTLSYYGFGSSPASPIVKIDTSGNLLTTGGITMYSDERKKTILNHVELSLKQVADAPIIEHYYNSDDKKTTHVGSIAQYWAGLNDWFCKEDGDGFLTMEIQNAALASAISVARELVRYESKTDKQIRLLKKRICELEDEIETLKGK